MICQYNGHSSLSSTNISNCISHQATAFYYNNLKSTTNASFCNFDNLVATTFIITQFESTTGIVVRCNYLNNTQKDTWWGLVFVAYRRFDIFDSSLQDNRKNGIGTLFSTNQGQIFVFRCHVDKYSANSNVYTSSKATDSFINALKFININPCEGSLLIAQNKDTKFAFFNCFMLISLINLYDEKIQ